MDSFTILNYQGSKKNLIDFIHKNTFDYIDAKKAVLDIFAGSCSVGYSFKNKIKVFTNDSEYFSYIISSALLTDHSKECLRAIKQRIENKKNYNYEKLFKAYSHYFYLEEHYLEDRNGEMLTDLYNNYPSVWNSGFSYNNTSNIYNLFTTYYAGSYFGVKQSFEIDSWRFAIEEFSTNKDIYCVLLASLFYAMKECVFSKDGHMAQPLCATKNIKKLLLIRKKSITTYFFQKLDDFFSNNFINTDNGNRMFNEDFQTLLKNKSIENDVGFIYADPPYTDMQYSRYYHLLNVVSKYDYPAPTISKNGYTKGLYTENRYQSKLSQKKNCFEAFTGLITFANCYKKNLAISFASPQDVTSQKNDRYVMTIEQIVGICEKTFGNKNVNVVSMEHSHSNNRNKQNKKVLEYLVLCKGVK